MIFWSTILQDHHHEWENYSKKKKENQATAKETISMSNVKIVSNTSEMLGMVTLSYIPPDEYGFLCEHFP